MCLYRRGGIWHYRFTIEGQRYRGSTKQSKQAAAKKVESLLMAEAMDRGSVLGRQKSPLLRDFSVDFLNWVEACSLDPDSKRYYTNGWRLLKEQRIAGVRLRDITTDMADALRFPGSAFTANTAFRTLRRMLHKAKEWKRLREVPKIKLREEFRRERMMEPEEEVRILAIAPQPLKDVLIDILDGGLRPNEVFSMRWEHVNWLRGTYLNPRGKSLKARRLVYLSDRMLIALQTRWHGETSGWIFPSKRASCGHIVTVEKQFLAVREALGLSPEVVLYCARHTFGTVTMQNTKDPAAVRDAMGHEDLKTTMTYLHPNLAVIREVINRKNAMLPVDLKEPELGEAELAKMRAIGRVM